MLYVSHLRRPPRPDPANPHYYPIAGHGLFRGLGRNKDVAGDSFNRPVGDQKAITIAVHLQPADREFAAAGSDRIVARTQLDEVAASRQARQGGLQFGALLAFGPDFTD